MSPEALSHPVYAPLRPWLAQPHAEWPDIATLNAFAAASRRPPVTAAGQPVRFCAPAPPARGRRPAHNYELRACQTGFVETRPGVLHDVFNALVWLAFPRTKSAINARHTARIPYEGRVRGPLRDLLTLFDESGVIVATADADLAALVRLCRWSALFWDQRSRVTRDMRFVVIGHATYEQALAPYPGITCKTLFVQTPRERLEGPFEDLVGWLDGEAAAWLAALPEDASPRGMPSLPVFGYPTWLPGSAAPEFYADERWFRPSRPRAGDGPDPGAPPLSKETDRV